MAKVSPNEVDNILDHNAVTAFHNLWDTLHDNGVSTGAIRQMSLVMNQLLLADHHLREAACLLEARRL